MKTWTSNEPGPAMSLSHRRAGLGSMFHKGLSGRGGIEVETSKMRKSQGIQSGEQERPRPEGTASTILARV